MKKILLFLACSIISMPLFAQYQEAIFGAKFGANMTNIQAENGSPVVTRLSIGITTEYKINTFIAFGAELNYGGIGYATYETVGTSQGSPVTDLVTYNYNTLSLPLLVKVYLFEKISLEGGIQVGAVLYAKRNERGDKEKLDRSEYNSLEFGIPVGIAYNAKSGVVLGTRVLFPKTTIYNDDKDLTVSAYIGYKF
ncbi:MAG: porin family protein [Rikenellaceae bacterium]